jgi:DNA-binding XRE family transcriptional regulator
MIRNEREHRMTKAAAEKLRAAISKGTADDPHKGIHRRLHRASIGFMKAQLAELDIQLEEYRSLREGRPRKHLSGSLDRIGDLLIKARIARGWTQKQLAARLGLQTQKIQEYESNSYQRASATRLIDLSRALGLAVHLKADVLALPDLSPRHRKETGPVDPAKPAARSAVK